MISPSLLADHYVLGDVLGSGGMGVVYSAIQLSLGRRVAIKFPHPELASNALVIRRFRTEAIAGSRLDHRNIARVIDVGGDEGAPFLVMEYVSGSPLDKLLSEQGAMQARTAADLCGQLLAALDEAHGAGVIHADIKSGNVLVELHADGVLQARVIDFGLARFCNEPPAHDDRLLSGTPDYLAPELVRGGVPTVASDLYAAGVVLYELLTGTTPFGGGSSDEILGRQLNDAVILPSLRSPEQDIPIAIEAVVMRALAKEPGARFATAALFADALRAATPVVLVHPRRLARGTPSVFAAERTTRNWPPTPVAFVPVGPTVERTSVQQLRDDVGLAIVGGDGDSIVAAYLELVRRLIDGGELATAAAELAHGLELLRPGATGSALSQLWRLQLCLAALYSGLGDFVRARGAAMLGQDDAIRGASEVGQDRAGVLLARLGRGGKFVQRER